jgi:hypothetical protein
MFRIRVIIAYIALISASGKSYYKYNNCTIDQYKSEIKRKYRGIKGAQIGNCKCKIGTEK